MLLDIAAAERGKNKMKVERTLLVKIKSTQFVKEEQLNAALESLQNDYDDFIDGLKNDIGADVVVILSDNILINDTERKILK